MDETSQGSTSKLTDKALAVALITMARYLAEKSPGIVTYLQSSLAHAQASDLADADLAMLRLLITSIGG